MNLKLKLLFLLSAAFILLLAACGDSGQSDEDVTLELDSAMEEELLALANDRDAWFLASGITTEALEGLYGSWSVVCRKKTSLADYKKVVYEVVRPLVLGKMELEDFQKADRHYEVESWDPPWAYVQQTWKLDDELIFGPQNLLFLVESGAWRYHDC